MCTHTVYTYMCALIYIHMLIEDVRVYNIFKEIKILPDYRVNVI